ncbi:MAG TPA: TonB-dependent receptor [Pedobacter sp.]|jgi:iron complex outermembrane receptor protein
MRKYLLSFATTILLLAVQTVTAGEDLDNGAINGVIKTSDGESAAFVSIVIKELSRSTISSESGSYSFKNIKPGNYTLKISFVGLEAQEKEVQVVAGETTKVDLVITENASKLAEVVITSRKSVNKSPASGTRININPLDLPQSISIVNSQTIADQQVNRLSDAIKNVSGLAMADTRGATAETFFARGYNLGANNIMKNGARSNSAVIPEASTLEKIEVLKGSAALLYGTVSSGAVINMITKKPIFEYGGQVSFRSGSYNFYKPIIDVYGPVTKKIAFRAVSTYETAKSFRKNVESERYYFNPSFLFNLSSKTSVLIQGDYMNNTLTPDFGIGTLNNTAIPSNISRSAFFNTPWAFNNAKQGNASASVDHKINKTWNFNMLGSFQAFDRDYFSTERIQASANGDWGRKLTRARTSEDYYTAQTNLTGKFSAGKVKHQLLFGTDGERYTNISNAFKIASLKTGDVYDTINIVNPDKFTPRIDEPLATNTSRTKTPTYRAGVFVQDLFDITTRIKILAGLRYSYQRIGAAKITNVQTGEVLPNSSLSTSVNDVEQALSPRLGVVFQPIITTSLYASYSNNFVPNAGIDIETQQNMRASFINQYEVGVKNDFLSGRLSANFSLYRIINSNLAITSDLGLNGKTGNTDSNIKQFAGQTTSEGAELDITGSIAQNLTFLAGYSYNFMRITKSDPSKPFSFIEGERLVNNPANTGNASVFYTFNLKNLKGLKVGASTFYTGKRNGGYNNRVGQTQKFDRLIPLSSFQTFDLSLGYSVKKLSLLAKISNITDELNYIVHENYSVNPIAPRQFVTTLSYKF